MKILKPQIENHTKKVIIADNNAQKSPQRGINTHFEHHKASVGREKVNDLFDPIKEYFNKPKNIENNTRTIIKPIGPNFVRKNKATFNGFEVKLKSPSNITSTIPSRNKNEITRSPIINNSPNHRSQMNEMIKERFPMIDFKYRPLRKSLSLPKCRSSMIEQNQSFYIEKVNKLENKLQNGKFASKSPTRIDYPKRPVHLEYRQKFTPNPFKNKLHDSDFY